MNSTAIKERIEKKSAMIEKKYNTIAKKEKLIVKKESEIAKLTDESEIKWKNFEIVDLKENVAHLKEQIEESKETLAKYEKQLAGEIEKEKAYINEVPEVLKNLEKELVNNWNEWDIKWREYMKEEYTKLGYRDFMKKYSFKDYEIRSKSDEEIMKDNEKDAKIFVLDLVNRVKTITGEITDWENIRLTVGNTFPVLTGYVNGKEGSAKVESITAGGWNIQRLHIRTLVKAL